MRKDVLILEISNILNDTGAYKKIDSLLQKYNLDIEQTVYDYDFEGNFVQPIIEQYEDNN
jgi:hypothetical protein